MPLKTKNLPPEVEKMVRSLLPDIQPIVDQIEAGPKTTKGHYGRYMASLSRLTKDQNMMIVLAVTMIRAGGDQYGINAAIKICTGNA